MVGFLPKSSILIGFSIIFTIHFGVPLFLETPISQNNSDKVCQIKSTREDFFLRFNKTLQVLLDAGARCSDRDSDGHDVAMLALKATAEDCVSCIRQRGGNGEGIEGSSMRNMGVFQK